MGIAFFMALFVIYLYIHPCVLFIHACYDGIHGEFWLG